MKINSLLCNGTLRARFAAVAGLGLAGALVVIGGGALHPSSVEREPDHVAQVRSRNSGCGRSPQSYFQSGDWRADARTLAAMMRYLCEPEP